MMLSKIFDLSKKFALSNTLLKSKVYCTWKNEKCLIWDFTCADTLCISYVKKAYTIFFGRENIRRLVSKVVYLRGFELFSPQP